MDFALSAEQTLLRDTVRGYCHDAYRFQDRLLILRSPDGFSRAHWSKFAELGWLGAALSEDVGGTGGSMIELAIILQEFGRCLVLEPFVACVVTAARAVEIAGNVEQRIRLLPALAEGKLLLALAHFEPDSRGDLNYLETRAERRANGGYRLTGTKAAVLGGSTADRLIVSARTSGGARDRSGVSLFEIEAHADGLARRSYRTVDGGSSADIVLNEVLVDSAALVGREGDAIAAVEEAIDRAIVAVCAEAVGAMDVVVALTGDYLKTRRAYGTTLSTFQALQHRLADMLVELELSRSMLYRALAELNGPARSRRRAVAAAKALIGRSGRFVGSYGIQLHGGMGMTDDYIIGHLFKRLTVIETQFGNSDFHFRHVLADEQAAPEAPRVEAGEPSVRGRAALSEATA